MGIMDTIFGSSTPSEQGSYADRGVLSKLLLGLGGAPGVQNAMNSDAIRDTFTGVNNGAIPKTEALQRYAQASGDPRALIQDGTTPAAIQEYNFVNGLNDDQRKLYFQNKRASQIFDTGADKQILSPQGSVNQIIPKTIPPEDLPSTKAAQTAASETAKAQVAKEQALPTAVANVESSIKLIDDTLAHPGLSESVGGLGGMRGRQAANFPVTEGQRNFQPFVEQLQGKAFLDAYDTLRGAGAIANAEGERATKAKVRMSQAQDEQSFRSALKDYQGVLRVGLERYKNGVKVPQAMTPAANNIPGAGANAPASTPNVVNFEDLPE